MRGGKFDYKLLNPADKQSLAYKLQEAVISSFSGWRLTNKSNETIALKLKVIFELSGRVQTEDDIVKNRISIDSDVITIRLVATRIIPRFTE
jgi:hypothetical protein